GTSEIAGMSNILDKASSLSKMCRKKGIPVIYTRHINRGDGIALANKEPVNEQGQPLYYHSKTETIEIADEVKPEQQDIIIDKYRYSGFFESNLELMLKSLDVNHLIIGGVLTDVCVLSTALDAYYRDYQINIVKDICGTTTEGAHQAAMLMMANWIYDLQVYDTKEIGYKLTGEKYHVWESTEPDQLQFSADNIREQYAKFS
ncbi:MAG TPA: isochorismatase family cysteine hydrolase, partial [Virgibacillus sp.]|nr:isochorismatase family cysteine hydrolase [Virgibacillus sp.]